MSSFSSKIRATGTFDGKVRSTQVVNRVFMVLYVIIDSYSSTENPNPLAFPSLLIIILRCKTTAVSGRILDKLDVGRRRTWTEQAANPLVNPATSSRTEGPEERGFPRQQVSMLSPEWSWARISITSLLCFFVRSLQD